MNSNKLLRIEDRFFTELRLKICAAAAGGAYVIGLAWLLLNGRWIVLADGRLQSIDFSYVWLSGRLAVLGDTAGIFENTTFAAARLSLFGPDSWSLVHLFAYPPTFLLFTYPLGFMPYPIAFGVWMLATFCVYQVAIYAIIPRQVAIIAAATSYPVVFNVLLGQNGFLTAGLMGLSLAFMESRPWLSGLFLGLLTYKPQFGILFPFALLASQNWRVLASATAVTIILGAIAAVAFGYQGWTSFATSLYDHGSSLSYNSRIPSPFISIFGFLQSAGVDMRISWLVHLLLAVIAAVSIFGVWATPVPIALKAAAICIGSVTVSPYVAGYDLCVLSIAVGFLVKDCLSRGFLSGDRFFMIACWIGLIPLSGPIPTIICVILIFLIGRRIAQAPRKAHAVGSIDSKFTRAPQGDVSSLGRDDSSRALPRTA